MAELIEAKYTAESGHWYTKTGDPAYTVKGANGKERPTTLRDARKLDLLPSVTTIIKCADKPGLTKWLIDQHILAALTLPRVEGETDDQLVERIKVDAQERARKARERGIQIHAWVQQGFEGVLTDPEGESFFDAAIQEVEKHCGVQKWQCERPFAYERFGGKCDLNIPLIVIDIKTTDKPLDGLKLWDEHLMQLSAYKRGLGLSDEARGAILYVNSVEPSARLLFAEMGDLAKGWAMFNALTDYWYAVKGLK